MGAFGHEQAGLKIIKVKTNELLTKVIDNRDAHKAEYEEALQGFMIDCRVRLKKELASLNKGLLPDKHLYFEAPENHTDDYDTVIDMLEMSVDEELEITVEQFQRYARDKWDWTDNFKQLSAVYNARL